MNPSVATIQTSIEPLPEFDDYSSDDSSNLDTVFEYSFNDDCDTPLTSRAASEEAELTVNYDAAQGSYLDTLQDIGFVVAGSIIIVGIVATTVATFLSGFMGHTIMESLCGFRR
ncbi:hypothetical protein IQ07DRAFT_640963 [Pyrenochaeta sp. DS3sAY3a]|nr:hypothetical protein IQ07DRAFT_640963 [Pyrenochaeta sp. DS3sAY3a]